jgi:hypothetical protein
MVELFMVYVFAAGYVLGQLSHTPRPHGVGTTVWSLTIITTTILWPIILTISIIFAIRQNIRANPRV